MEGYFAPLDYMVIVGYLACMLGAAFYLKKMASSSLEDYCIGNRSIPWWALGASGMASWVDVAGTMLIVSWLYMLGPRGLFIEFRGGAGLLLPFMMLWTGKWLRRSRCLTPAEWMLFRFGDGWGGRFAQLAAAAGIVATTIGMLAYLVKAVGLFYSMFIPLSPITIALLLVVFATIYTMISGFYGVVFTDVFQSGIVITMVIVVVVTAVSEGLIRTDFTEIATSVTGQEDWATAVPSWDASMPRGYEMYQNVFMFAVFYLINNAFRGMGFPGDPKYFGARNDRECGTLSFLWINVMTLRWPLMMGFAILGIFLVNDMFTDLTVLEEASIVIKDYFPGVSRAEWTTVLSNIINYPERYADLRAQLQETLGGGEGWMAQLQLVSYDGTVNPERIMPAVLLHSIGRGFRGLMIIGLIAATMSTFDSHVNLAAGVFVRDIYQKYIHPDANNRRLIFVAWAAVIGIVGSGILFAYTLESVNEIWGWIVMGLGAGALVPGFLRMYWWRYNGAGFAGGTFFGMVMAYFQRLFTPYLIEISPFWEILRDERWFFVIIASLTMIVSIACTYLAPPTRRDVLEKFYKTTRPFGLWGPLKNSLSEEVRKKTNEEHFYDIVSLPFVLTYQVSLFLLPMLIMLQNYQAFTVTLVVFIISALGVYYFWYRTLLPIQETAQKKAKEKEWPVVQEDNS